MSYVVVDVEADGPIPNKYSMVCFGAVIVEPGLAKSFYGKTKPTSENWQKETLATSGISRREHESFDDPREVMEKFRDWIVENSQGRAVFVSDNPVFDWQWINYYFHTYIGENPLGYSGRRIGDLYCGMRMDMGLSKEWKHNLRKTPHDHNPLNDAIGNAEAMLAMQKMGLKFQDFLSVH